MCSTHTEAILEWLKGSMWTSFLDVFFLISSPLPRIGCHRPQIDQMSSDELVNRTWKSSKRSSFLQLECTSLWRASLLLQLNEYILRRVCCSIPCMCLDSHIRNNNLLLLGQTWYINHRILLFLSPLEGVDGLTGRLTWQRACRTAWHKMRWAFVDGMSCREVSVPSNFHNSCPLLSLFIYSLRASSCLVSHP